MRDRSPRNTKQQTIKTVSRRAIIVASSEIPVAVDSESRGPNMETVVGENRFRSFSENWRCHGTICVLGRERFSLLRRS